MQARNAPVYAAEGDQPVEDEAAPAAEAGTTAEGAGEQQYNALRRSGSLRERGLNDFMANLTPEQRAAILARRQRE